MTAALVQNISGNTVVAGPGTISVTYAAPPAKYDLLVACLRSNTLIAGITAPSGWTAANTDDNEDSGFSIGIWYKVAGASESSTVTFTVGNVATRLHILEFSGVAPASPLDKAPAATDPTGGGTTCATGSTGTLSSALEVAVACVGLNGTSGGGISWNSGFSDVTVEDRLLVGYLITAATTALNPQATWTTTRGRDGVVATFTAAVVAVLAAPLGALSGSLAATPNHPAVLAGTLADLASTIAATVEHPAMLDGSLGALTGTLAATVGDIATLDAPLGSLVASASATVEHPVSLAAPLGGLAAQLAATVEHSTTLDAQLGELTAAMTATVPAPVAVPTGGAVRRVPPPVTVKHRSRVVLYVTVVSTHRTRFVSTPVLHSSSRTSCGTSVCHRTESAVTAARSVTVRSDRHIEHGLAVRSEFLRGVPSSYRHQRDEHDLLTVAALL